MTNEEEWGLADPDWRDSEDNDMVMLESGMVVSEKEVYYAVEKLTPYLQKKENRFPNEEDIETFIILMRGP